jgi:hypothetical protein
MTNMVNFMIRARAAVRVGHVCARSCAVTTADHGDCEILRFEPLIEPLAEKLKFTFLDTVPLVKDKLIA